MSNVHKKQSKFYFNLIFIVVVGGKDFVMTNDQLVLPLSGSKCRLAVAAGDSNMYLFGDPFIRSYCQIHDVEKKRVGFAPSKQTIQRRKRDKVRG